MSLTPSPVGLADWLHRAALAGDPLEKLLGGYCRELMSAGFDLARCAIGVDTLHPTLEGYFLVWRPESPDVNLVEYTRDQSASEVDFWLASPFHHLATTGKTMLRRRVAVSDGPAEFPIIADLAADGVSDYVAFLHGFGAGTTVGELDGVYSSWTTRRPGGFRDDEIAALAATMPTLALAVKSESYAQIARNLAQTYLGREIGTRVLAGEIVRGKAERLEAVVWFSDLAGYTRITDTSPPEALLPLLNDYAEAVVEAIHAMKGEVLKFIGDGVLALFRGATTEESCRRALAAVLETRRRVAELNDRRDAAGAPSTNLYLALHLGEVFFGNIGSADRLDFTAVGPAVNETSRVVAMCRSLDQEVLVTAAFAANAGDARARLVSVGRYALRGVARPQELFTLDPEIAS